MKSPAVQKDKCSGFYFQYWWRYAKTEFTCSVIVPHSAGFPPVWWLTHIGELAQAYGLKEDIGPIKTVFSNSTGHTYRPWAGNYQRLFDKHCQPVGPGSYDIIPIVPDTTHPKPRGPERLTVRWNNTLTLYWKTNFTSRGQKFFFLLKPLRKLQNSIFSTQLTLTFKLSHHNFK